MSRRDEIKSAYKNLGKAHSFYDGMMTGTSFFGRIILKNVWCIRYKFTQCPNAEFAKKHGFEDIMPLLCNTDYYGMDQLHACLIRTSNCVKGSFCDFCIVADQNPLADKYERIRDEYGFIISKEKKGTDLYVLGQSGRSI